MAGPRPKQNKTSATCQAIQSMVDKLEAEAKLPTVGRLCETLKVSRVTLDRALTRLEDQGVIVRKHGRGIYASPRHRTPTIALLLGINPFAASTSHYYRLLINHLSEASKTRGYRLHVYVDLPEDHPTPAAANRTDLQRDLEAGLVAGVFICAHNRWRPADWLERHERPYVVLTSSNVSHATVTFNGELIMEWSIKALVERGCERIGLADHPLHDVFKRRSRHLTSFKAQLHQWGCPFSKAWCCLPTRAVDQAERLDSPTWEELTYFHFADLFAGATRPRDLPDGLVVLDDMMTRGLLAAMHRARLVPGRDIRIATQANRGSPTLLGYEHDLIRLQVDPAEQAREAVNILTSRIEGRRLRQSRVWLDPVLIPEEPLAGRAASAADVVTTSPES